MSKCVRLQTLSVFVLVRCHSGRVALAIAHLWVSSVICVGSEREGKEGGRLRNHVMSDPERAICIMSWLLGHPTLCSMFPSLTDSLTHCFSHFNCFTAACVFGLMLLTVIVAMLPLTQMCPNTLHLCFYQTVTPNFFIRSPFISCLSHPSLYDRPPFSIGVKALCLHLPASFHVHLCPL